VLLLDAGGQDALTEHLGGWTVEVLALRGEQINVPVLLTCLLKGRRLGETYIDSFIRRVRPRLIVTFVDNNILFYSLKAKHPGVKTLFIQNGTRGYYQDIFETLATSPSDRYHVDYMMTFGSRIGAEYARRVKGEIVPMGSLSNNRAPRRRNKEPGTIGFISQYRNTPGLTLGGRFFTREEFFERPDRIVLSFLADYASRTGRRLVVIPCGHLFSPKDEEEERRYYRDLLGPDAAFLPASGMLASYDNVDSVEVAVTIDGSLGYESLARGNRTAVFALRSGIEGYGYAWPDNQGDDGPFWTQRPDQGAFQRVMDHLFSVSDQEWQAELSRHRFSTVMAYDPGNTILQSVLNRALGRP
jgi:surface carbohydrate biosynthesis protein